ncbi:hypothetical protein FQN57_002607 [Myotisia sp. PD_48]|nr:hypothetical protein FQN57_002607 [Myotisia sp. PD_48]
MNYNIRKRKRAESPGSTVQTNTRQDYIAVQDENDAHPATDLIPEEDSTDMKLAKLASVFPDIDPSELLDILIANEGSLESTVSSISEHKKLVSRERKNNISNGTAIQSSLSCFKFIQSSPKKSGLITTPTRKGRTLHLYSPEDISRYTPCTIIHNFLPSSQATALLNELLVEAETFERQKFQLFDTVVSSPHSAGFYVSSAREQQQQRSEYSYNGNYRTDVRQLTPELRKVSIEFVKPAVNREIEKRIQEYYPDGKKLKYQSPREWEPNAAFVNCYDGAAESVGYHSDELTYLGPRAVIGSLSLGVAREFRVRRIVPPVDSDGEEEGKGAAAPSRADIQGQISIHLPHNSLLVMHAETQEEWKHSISPAQNICPHPIAGNKRINVTYRWYRESLHPKNTPRCRCNMPCVLRCVQRKKDTRGKYMWMCYAGYAPGKKTCSFFQWAEFDDDGEPIWDKKTI